MKKSLIVLAVLLLAVSFASAQVRTGTLYGKVTDSEKTPLPGATVTISSNILAPLTTITSAQGMFRFPSLYPANDYQITAELTGFKKAQKTGIIITVASNVEINLTMEMGKLEEQVTVTAVTPVVDAKKTVVSTNLNNKELQSLPTARDPWVVMQLAPSIMLDRENVGGNESGQQSTFLAKGDMSNNGYVGSDNIWAIDGIDITDPAALGGSALYFDFDMFEELNITTGGAADVTIQTGGIALNMVTRRGGNKANLAGRFYLTDNYFQANNLTDDLKAQGVAAVNKIQQIKDFGVNAGGAILKDKLWVWAAYGVQDIFNWTMYSTQDKTLLNNYNFKLNAQFFPNNRFEALVTAGAKEKFGRNAAVNKPEGDHQQGKYHWGSPILKLQDEHVFGNNFYVSMKFSFNDAGFGWRPMTDAGLDYPVVYDQANSKYIPYASNMLASWSSYYASRPRHNYQVNANYFNDSLFGLAHEIKVGAEYSHKVAAHQWGNFQGFDINANYNSLVLDTNGDGTRTTAEMAGWQRVNFYRDGRDNGVADQYAGYVQDTITKGRFTFMLGLRYDLQVPSQGITTFGAVYPDASAWKKVFDPSVNSALSAALPSVTADAVKGIDNYRWSTFSPRLSLTYDITGDGKTLARITLSQYGDVMGTGTYTASPLGTGGGMRFWWKDANADKLVQFTEMYWAYSSGNANKYKVYNLYTAAGAFTAAATAALAGGYLGDAYIAGMYYGYDWNNKTALDYTNITQFFQDKSVQSSTRTRDFMISLEREIAADFSAAVNFTMRRYDNFDFNMTYYPASQGYTGALADLIIDPQTPPTQGPWYVKAGTIPSTVTIGGKTYDTKGAAGRDYYMPASYYPTAGTPYAMMRKSDSYNTYTGLEFVVTKRLSNKWFMNASFTWQNQKNHWGTDFFDPTNQWMSDGMAYGQWGGGASGKVPVLMYTRWMFKVSAMYQLPLDINISGTFNAREGWKVPNYFYIENDNAPNPYYTWSTSIYTEEVVADSLPTFYNFTLRIEKMVTIGGGRLYLMADCFNLLNSALINRSYEAYFGDAYFHNVGTVSTQYDSWGNPTNRTLNEILNPRVVRFGVRFEF